MLAKPLATCTHLSSTVSQLFEPQVQKIAVFTYRSPHFCFPWRRPCNYHAICCIDGKTIQWLPNPSPHVPIYLQQFPSYTMLKSMRKSKNRHFYHIFVSLGDAPVAITLNVVWMESEFGAYKLSRYTCPSNYNRFLDRARYLSKIVIFSYPLAFDALVRGSRRNIATPFGTGKLEWCRYPMVKKFRRYVYSF